MKRKLLFNSQLLLILTVFCLNINVLSAQPEIPSQWEGKRVAFLGDSITDSRQIAQTNNIYWNFLRDILGIEPYVYGISGHRMNQIIGQAEKLEAEHGQGVDAILVFIGTNDYNGNIPLGEWYTYSEQTTIDDGPKEVVRKHRELIYDDSTFRGRANTTVRWLKTHYPDKQIIFLTPIHRGYAKFNDRNIQPEESYANACGHFVDEYVQAVREIADVWAVPVIDLAAISGLYPMLDEHAHYFRNAQTDRLHPNTPGQHRMAYALAYQLLGYPASFPKYAALSFDSSLDRRLKSQIDGLLSSYGITASYTAFAKLAKTTALDPAGVKDGDIIYLQNYVSDEKLLETLKTLVPELLDRGFELLSVPELYLVRAKEPAAYYNGEIINNIY